MPSTASSRADLGDTYKPTAYHRKLAEAIYSAVGFIERRDGPAMMNARRDTKVAKIAAVLAKQGVVDPAAWHQEVKDAVALSSQTTSSDYCRGHTDGCIAEAMGGETARENKQLEQQLAARDGRIRAAQAREAELEQQVTALRAENDQMKSDPEDLQVAVSELATLRAAVAEAVSKIEEAKATTYINDPVVTHEACDAALAALRKTGASDEK